VECKVQEWLEQLAGLLQPVRLAPHPPNSINLGQLHQQLPLPASIVRHYGSVGRFVDAMPALERTGQASDSIQLVPLYHHRLLQAAREHEG
jgi:hypothetical protein